MIYNLRSSISRSIAFASLLVFALILSQKSYAQTSGLVISQVYGAGGNSGAAYNYDYVELFNPTASPIVISNWSVQYAATAGTSWSVASITAATVQAGKYLLIRLGTTNSLVGTAIPTPDITGSVIDMAAANGKVALVSTTTAITSGTSNPVGLATLIDYVGYGTANAFEGAAAAPAASAANAVFRASAGCQDYNSNNLDFTAAAAAPRNSATAAAGSCNTAVYYWNGSGSLTSTASWGTTIAGGGTSPGTMTAARQTLNLRNATTATLSASLAIGFGSKMVLENSDLTVGSTTTLTGTVDVNAGRTLTWSNASMPTFGTLSTTSTVVYSGMTIAASPTIPVTNIYGNLTFTNTTVASPAAAVNLSFAGNFVLTGTSKFLGGSITSATGGYNLIATGSANQTINGGGLRLVVRNLNCNDGGAKTGTLSLNSANTNITVTNSILMNNTGSGNAFSDGGNTLTVYNSVAMGGDAAGYSLTGTIIDSAYAGVSSIFNGYSGGVVSNSVAPAPTFKNLTIGTTSTATVAFMPASGGTVSIDGNLNVVSTGTGAITLNGNTVNLKGNYTYTPSTSRINSAGSTLVLNGSVAQTYSTNVVAGNTFNNVTVTNTNGLTLTTGIINISGTLNLSGGKVTTGANTVALTSTGSLTGVTTAKYINGNLSKTLTSAATATYDVGDANAYSPVTLTFNGGSASGVIAVKSSVWPSTNGGSYINTSYFTNRYWAITNTSGTGFTDLDALFNYNLTDISATTGGATSNSAFVVRKYSSSAWTQPTSSNPSSTSTQASAVASASVTGEYVIGELAVPPIISSLSSYSAIPGATLTITGSNFNATPANNKVFFGATQATIGSGSTTTLSVTVPTGALLVPATVTLPLSGGLIGYSPRVFVPEFDASAMRTDTLSFKSHVDFTNGIGSSTPYSGAIGDIDGDGKPDLVVNNVANSSVSVFINTSVAGSITLSPSSSFTLTNTIVLEGKPNNVKLADLNGDGKLDIIMALTNSNNLQVIRNTTTTSGSPTFAGRQSFAAGNTGAVVAIADFDLDGKPDVALTLPTGGVGLGGIVVFRNTSTLSAISFSSSVISNSIISGFFVPSGVVATDLDGDGLPDLATSVSGFNGSAYTGTTVSMFRNTSTIGAISFGSEATLTTANGPIDIAAGDIDGDNKTDLVVTNNGSNSFSAFRNVATSGVLNSSSFSTKVDFTTGTGTTGIAFADLNGDGKLDIVTSNATANTLSLFRNTTTSSGTFSAANFATKIDVATGSLPTTVTIGDLDGDTYPDLVNGNAGATTVSVIRNYPLPQVSTIAGTAIVCANSTITLSNATSGGTWISARPSVATVSTLSGTVGSVTALPSSVADTVTIVYRVIAGTGNGDTNYAMRVVTINPQPGSVTATIAPSPVCIGSNVSVSGTATGASTYSWSGPGGYSSTLLNPGAFATNGSSGGIYTLTAITANSCSVIATSNTVTLSTPPTSVTASVTPTTVCVGSNLTLTGSASGASSYSWSGPNSYSAAAANPAAFAATSASAGVYTLSAISGACTVTATTTLIVNVPAPTISGATTIPSGSSTTLTFSGVSGDVIDYIWTGGGSASTTIDISGTSIVTVSPTSTTTYSITSATSSYGCFATITGQSTIISVSNATILGTATICAGNTTTLYFTGPAGGQMTYNQDGGSNIAVNLDGSGNASITTPVLSTTSVFNLTGITAPYSATITGQSVTITVTPTVTPTVSIGVSPSGAVCAGTTVTLTATPTNGGGAPAYQWKLGGSNISGATNTTYVYVPANGDVITCELTSNAVCPSPAIVLSNAITITVNAYPSAGTISGASTVCETASITLTDGAPSGVWSSSNGTLATVNSSGIVTGILAGTVDISYTVTSSGCATTATHTVTVNAAPGAGTISGASTVCENALITLTDGTPAGTWSTSNAAIATVNGSGVVTGVLTGTATISYTVTSGGCSGYATHNITVNATPSAGTITGASSVCEFASVTLSDGVGSGTWSSSASGVATVNSSGVVTGAAAGTADISYSVTVSGCSASAIHAMTVDAAPAVAAITGSSSVCVSSSVTLSDVTASGVWSSSNNAVATVDAAGGVTGVSGGTVNISYTVTSGCSNSAIRSITVNTLPSTPAISSPGYVYGAGSTTLTFTGSAGSVVYYWNGSTTLNTTLSGGGTSSVTVSPTVTTTYSVTSVTSSLGCSVSVTGVTTTVNFLGTPVTLIGWDMSSLPGGTNNFGPTPYTHATLVSNLAATTELTRGAGMTVSGSAAARGWGGTGLNSSDSITAAAANKFASFSIKADSIYKVSLNAYTISYRRSGTGATKASLQYSLDGVNYTWVGGLSFTNSASTGATISNIDLSGVAALQNIPSTTTVTFRLVEYGASATGGTWYIYDVGNSTADDYFYKGTVNCISAPVGVSASASSTALCAGNTLTISGAAIGATSYSWSGPGSFSSTLLSPPSFTSSVSASGIYTLTATNACGSTTVTTSSVTVDALPTGVAANATPSTVCAGSTLTISGTATGASTYSWTGPNSFSSTLLNPASFTSATASAGAYTLSAINGTCTVTAGTTVTVSNLPTAVTASVTPTSICVGSTMTLSSTATGTSLVYSWTGPNSFTSTLQNPASFAATIPAAGSYSLVVSSGVCSVSAATVAVAVYSVPAASITSAVAPCMGYSTTVVFTGTPAANITYTIDGGANNTAALDAGTGIYSLATGDLTSSHTYALVNAFNPACTTVIGTTVTITPVPMQWVGGTGGGLESNWNTTSNWSCGFVPGLSDDVTIPSGTTYAPALAVSGTATVRNLTIASGVTLNLNSGSTLNIKGTVNNAGTIAGLGTAKLNGSALQTITGIGAINNLELNNASGASISTGARVTINKELTITAGNLATNDSLVLASSDTIATARIAPIVSGSITGNVQIRQYIQGGYRRYRFVSHPFSSTISFGQLQDYIDITGVGGASNGFTTTGSNAPSLFRFSTYGSNVTPFLSYDMGWRDITNITPAAADSNTFHKHQGMLMFMRGAKGEGLGYWFTYVPSPTTFAMHGPVNQGTQNVTLLKGTGSQYINMLGNPYPSPVDLGVVAHNALVSGDVSGAAFFVWNPSIGASGQYQAVPINTVSATHYYLPAYTAFQIHADHDSATLTFTENDKSATATNYLFKTIPEAVSLYIYDNSYHPWDMLYVRFNDAATEGEDKYLDATKPTGADFNFYSLSSDNKRMVIDSRPYKTDKIIPLGINSAYAQEFIIKAEGVVAPDGSNIYLHDKLLDKYVLLEQGTEYRFSITKDKATQGENRFEISMKPAAATETKGLHVSMTPNPATDEVKISFTSGKKDNVSVRILDMSGVSVYNNDMGLLQNGNTSISLSGFASGIYMVELTSGSEKIIHRLVKE